MLFATALKEGVTGPDFTGNRNYKYKNGEQRLLLEDQRGYYEKHPDSFKLIESTGVVASTESGDLLLPNGGTVELKKFVTFSNLPPASSVPFARYYILDINNSEWYSDGTQWRPANHISLASNGNPNAVTVGSTETVLAQYTFKPSQIHKNGRVIVDAFVSYPNSANNKTFYLRLGGTGINGAILWQQNQTTTTTKYNFRAGFQNRNAMNSQVQSNTDYGSGYGGTTTGILTSSVDMTQEQTLYLTAACASASEAITLQSYSITQA